MARAPQRSRTGPVFAGMVAFLALSAVLIVVCVFLTLGYLKRGASLTKLQGEIKRDLEDPLAKGLSVRALPVASASDAAYDDAFFNRIQKSALDGINYAALSEKTGYTGENPINDITSELQKSQLQPEPENLRDYIAKLKEDLGARKRELSERNQALQMATAQLKDAQNLQAQEGADLKATVDKAATDLQDARAAYDKDLATVKELMAKADEEQKAAWAENHAQADLHKKETADLQAKIQKLEQNVREMNEELTRKMPKAVAVTEGLVLQADALEGVAIINLGKNEQIQNGEKFTVVRVGRGGERKPKGELQVVRVDALVSRTEILNSDPGDPVMRDDIVLREKKTE
jgi:predicted  nucleic acid-binding Zn-ribbon protein